MNVTLLCMKVRLMSSQADNELLARARAMHEAIRSGSHITGLGDVVAKALKLPVVAGAVKALTGIDPHKPCGGCKKRQAWLNEKVPIGR